MPSVCIDKFMHPSAWKVISANVVSWCFPKFAQAVRRYGHLADVPSCANDLSCLKVWQETRKVGCILES
jgi:hypothetical protein